MSTKSTFNSPNFQFLAAVNPLLVELAARAERYALEDPNTSMIKLRQLSELLAQLVAAKSGVKADSRQKDQRSLIDELYSRRAIPAEIKSLFHTVRMEGNDANHAMKGHEGQAITLLRHTRKIAVWYYRAYINGNQKLGGFGELVPQDPNDEPASELLARICATREAAAAKKKTTKKKAASKKKKKSKASSK